jgi:hypothetical protein
VQTNRSAINNQLNTGADFQQRSMTFEENFRTWLAQALSEPIPASVSAYSFNLFEYPETPEVKFGIELIGTGSFDPADADWACDEVWEPAERRLEIPTIYSSREWEECQRRLHNLVLSCIDFQPGGAILRQKQAVGLGFIDGELQLVWQR